jgi:hypothetical protein
MRPIMHRFVLGLLLLFLVAATVSAGSAETPASVNWNAANPLAVRGQLVALALYDGLVISIGLVDHSILNGIIGEVGPESFVLNSVSPAQSVSIPLTLVRSIQWIEPDKAPRSFKIKQAVRELHDTPSTIVRVELRNHHVLSGRIREAADLWFVLVAPDSGSEQIIDYREVSQLSGGKISTSVTAEEVFKTIGLVLAGIVFLPLMILAALSGWDGC